VIGSRITPLPSKNASRLEAGREKVFVGKKEKEVGSKDEIFGRTHLIDCRGHLRMKGRRLQHGDRGFSTHLGDHQGKKGGIGSRKGKEVGRQQKKLAII